MIGRLFSTAVALAVTASGLLLVDTGAIAATTSTASPTTASPTTASPSSTTPTSYALAASGYASRVEGGSVPVDSGATAFQAIGCTNQAGLSKTNTQATVRLPGIGRLSAARTRVWTTDLAGVTTAQGRDSISKVVFADTGLGSVSLDGIVSRSQAFHDEAGFHAKTRASLGSITLTLLGVETHFPVPAPGQSVTIPGVATITVGAGINTETANSAEATLDAVTVELIPTGTTVHLAHSHAQIQDGIQSAVFGGSSYGTQMKVIGGIGQIGQTPRIVMPCQGTNGKLRVRNIASVALPPVGSVDGLSASQSAAQTATTANAMERGEAAKATLAGGALVITGIRGQANASYTTGSSVLRDASGTTLAKVVFNGQVLRFPRTGPLVIPGVASLTPKLVRRIHDGIDVTALQITLLDGSGAIINLGHAKVRITPSGL